MLVLGCLCLVLAGTMALLALSRKQSLPSPLLQLSGIYGLTGLLLILIRSLLGFFIAPRKQMPYPPITPILDAVDLEAQPQRISPPRRNQDGMVLPIVLILLSLVTGLVMHILYAQRLDTRMDQLRWTQTRLRTALTDEALYTLGRLADDEERAVDHLEKEWNRPVETERPDGVTTITRVTDLNRMFDLNNLADHQMPHTQTEAERMVSDLILMTGDFAPVERIEALTDWVSTTNTGTYTSAFYMQKDAPYRTPDTPLHTWSELLWVHGFDTPYFERKPLYKIARPFSENLIDLACIIPGPDKRPIPININTAPKPVLEAVLGPERETLVRYIELARLDQPYRSIDALLALADPGYLEDVRPFLDVRSNYFLVEVNGFAAEHRAHLRVVAQRDTEGNIRIRQWVL